jgi:hypothetical protein
VQRLDTNLNGALGSTLNQIYNADSSRVGWVIYNGSIHRTRCISPHAVHVGLTWVRGCLVTDQTPDNKEHTSNGHTKGDMAFDANGGFWLVHSVPRFPAATGSGSYAGYPAYAKEYGQSFICMSYGALSFIPIPQRTHCAFHTQSDVIYLSYARLCI